MINFEVKTDRLTTARKSMTAQNLSSLLKNSQLIS